MCQALLNMAATRPGVNGTSRKRMPVASWTAFAIAGAITVVVASPAPRHRLVFAIDQHDRDLRNLAEAHDRITVPIEARHAGRVERDLLFERAAGRLDRVALDLVAQTVGVHDQAAIVSDREFLTRTAPVRRSTSTSAIAATYASLFS